MNSILIRGGTVINPETGTSAAGDVLAVDGKISAIGPDLKPDGTEIVEAKGLVVAPGLVDMHVHLREPGQEGKETVATGTRAAAKGGVTTIACMPNTTPPLDSSAIVAYLMTKVAQDAVIRVHPIGCISAERKGEVLADISALKEAGVVAISDDGSTVMNALLARRAMVYAQSLGIPYIEHAEDINLADNGVINEGLVSLRLGLSGLSPLAEEVIVARDILLAEATGVRLHITHVSTARSVEMVRDAKKRKLLVTCDVTPHHIALTDEMAAHFDTYAKVNPPLRKEGERKALVAGVLDGTIDAIASDHAPHGPTDKDVEFGAAAFGTVGLETMLGACIKVLGEAGMKLPAIMKLLSIAPARILGIGGGRMEVGAAADLIVFDPAMVWTVDAKKLVSKSKNSVFHRMQLKGRALWTLMAGEPVLREGELVR